jgi:ER-derived vesicles protein
LFRNLALVGALLLVLAESREDEGRGLFAGLPSVGRIIKFFILEKN